MESERLKKIEELFHAALEIAASERAAFIVEACGDDEALRLEVESLIAAYEETPQVLEYPPWSRMAQPSIADRSVDGEAEADLPFEKLGGYRLLSKLGEGGMGLVYLAVQEPLGRKVALKVIRPEQAGSFEITKRFWREVEAVSKLRHQNIVTVFGSGEEKGVCYFAMELVPGKGLNEILREAAAQGAKVPTPKILGWIKDIAHALEAAHQAGIIHRDVKPSNIRISTDGQALLTDFGVARHADLSTLTLTGQFRGTPHYASPEQVRARRRRIDARTDIYSLGVTLYEAVTGRVPFEGETTEQVFHQILDEDPVPPRRLNPSISRDLDTLILAAMEKDLGRRYQSMTALAGDLGRVLDGEPISIKPTGLITKLWKSARRRPALSATLAMGFVSAVVLLMYIFCWSVPSIIEQKNRALTAMGEADAERAAAVTARDEAERRRKEADAARDAAETEARKTQAVYDFLNKMFTSADPVEDGRSVTVMAVLDDAVGELEDAFPDQPEIETALRNMIGNTYYALGLFDRAEEQFLAAGEVGRRAFGEEAPETLGFLCNYARVLASRGELAAAETLHRQVLEARKRTLGRENRDTILSMYNLACVLMNQGNLPQAETLFRETAELARGVCGEEDPDTLNAMDLLSGVLMLQGDFAGAEVLGRKVFESRRRVVGDEHLDTVASMVNYSQVLLNLKRFDEAEALLRDALKFCRRDLSDEHVDTLKAKYYLALTLWEQGEYLEAEGLHREVVDVQRRMLGDEHPNTVHYMVDLAGELERAGKIVEAEALYTTLLEIGLRILDDQRPKTLASITKLINAFTWKGQFSNAEKLSRKLLEFQRAVCGENDKNTIVSMTYLAFVLWNKRGPEPEKDFAEAAALYRQVTEFNLSHFGSEDLNTLTSKNSLAQVLLLQGKAAEAEPLLRGVVETAERTLAAREMKRLLFHMTYGECLLKLSRYSEAEPQLLCCYEGLREMMGAGHGRTLYLLDMVVALYDAWGKPEKAAEYRARRAAPNDPADPTSHEKK